MLSWSLSWQTNKAT